MERKSMLIFFDIDGPLLNDKGVLRESAGLALQRLKEKGHKIFLATGRSKVELPEQLLDLEFQGMVLGNGSYVEYAGKEIYRDVMDKEMLYHLSQDLEQWNAHILYGAKDACYVWQSSKEYLLNLMQEMYPETGVSEEMERIMMIIHDSKDINQIEKINFFNYKGNLDELKEKFSDYFYILPNSIVDASDKSSGEVTKIGINKAVGISHILNYIDETKESVIALGDGYNDIEMIQFSHIGIAMENSVPILKQYADMIAPDIDADGVYTVLEQLKLV